MSKLLLLGIILYMAVLPLFYARSRSPKRALRSLQIACVVAVFVWSYLALVVYPQYAPLWKQVP